MHGDANWGLLWANEYMTADCPLRKVLVRKAQARIAADRQIVEIHAGRTLSQLSKAQAQVVASPAEDKTRMHMPTVTRSMFERRLTNRQNYLGRLAVENAPKRFSSNSMRRS